MNSVLVGIISLLVALGSLGWIIVAIDKETMTTKWWGVSLVPIFLIASILAVGYLLIDPLITGYQNL